LSQERTSFITRADLAAEAFGERRHCLEMVSGDDAGRRFEIGAHGLTIGRYEPATIVLPELAVSRLHCRLALDDHAVIVTDLESTNGSYVDGVRIAAPTILPVGGILQVGYQFFKHELLTGKQLQQSEALERDIAAASAYVRALLPTALDDVQVAADWVYQPCAKLGGDVFGYGYLSDSLFTAYLVDVSGHGAGAAMHGVAVMNLLRQRALPDTDFSDPGAVLERLNAVFQMDRHADMYFTIWYGVYDLVARRLTFASGGHHPAYLVPAHRREAVPLGTRNPIIGAMPGRRYGSQCVAVPPGASVYLFSDGVFEIVSHAGEAWRLGDFVPLILADPPDALTEPMRLYRTMRAATRDDGFDDDFSLVVLTFK
jgi:serine phosphatase RsbU (regulator of sigma subunit)